MYPIADIFFLSVPSFCGSMVVLSLFGAARETPRVFSRSTPRRSPARFRGDYSSRAASSVLPSCALMQPEAIAACTCSGKSAIL